MTVLAVKTYVAQQAGTVAMGGLPWPFINSYVQRPREDFDAGVCMVTVTDFRRIEKRMRGNRGAGSKEEAWQVVLMMQALHEDATVGGNSFDVLMENMEKMFRTGPGQATVQDPITLETSTLTHIGEQMDLRGLPPMESSPPAEVIFRATLTLALTEYFTG